MKNPIFLIPKEGKFKEKISPEVLKVLKNINKLNNKALTELLKEVKKK